VLAAAGIAVGLIVLVAAMLAVAAGTTRSRAWPFARSVAVRLKTDEQARDLFRRNPALADSYSSEEKFIERVREHREGLMLPESEPPQGPEFKIMSSPFEIRIRLKGEGGTWMEVVADLGGPFRPAPAGEGIRRLNLAKDPRDLRRQVQLASGRGVSGDWERFVRVCASLAAEGGPEALRRDVAGLQTVPVDAAAFEAMARQRRKELLAIPADRQAMGSARVRIHSGPFSRTVEIEAPFQEGGGIRAQWRQEKLVGLALH
jgi:hypothetical protein